MSRPIRFAVLTVSDRCSRGQAQDTSGPALRQLIEEALGGQCVATACLPDETDAIASQLQQWCDAPGDTAAIDLAVTTGGTGLAPRDVTPEATLAILHREHPGLMELARMRCLPKTPRTYLSRGIAGTRARTLILNLPGSQRGATDTLQALLDVLPHAIETLRGEVQDDGRSDAVAITGKVIRHDA
jgi:molybdopterin adenylyltransferase